MFLSRREFLKLAGTGALGLAACSPTPTLAPIPRPGAIASPLPTATPKRLTKEDWVKLSARDKIGILEFGQHPADSDFNPSKELVSAVAGFYCQETKCNTPAETMAANVSFVSGDEIIQALEKEYSRTLRPDEKQEARRSKLEVVVDNESKILINEELLAEGVRQVPIRQPNVLRGIGTRDLRTVMIKSVLFHAFSHVNMTPTRISFDPFSIRIPGEAGPVNIDRAERFNFIGKRSDESPFYLNGTNEALTETAAILMAGKLSSPYISFNTSYSMGAESINYLCRRANITPKEFLQYMSVGQTGADEFARRIGTLKNRVNPDKKAAMMALFTIGMGVDGIILPNEVLPAVDKLLTPQTNMTDIDISDNDIVATQTLQPAQPLWIENNLVKVYQDNTISRRDLLFLRLDPSERSNWWTANDGIIFQG